MNATHPLAHLAQAEADLVAQIDAAASALDSIAVNGIDAALARLAVAAQAATDRLARAAEVVRAIAGGVLLAASNVAEVACGKFTTSDFGPSGKITGGWASDPRCGKFTTTGTSAPCLRLPSCLFRATTPPEPEFVPGHAEPILEAFVQSLKRGEPVVELVSSGTVSIGPHSPQIVEDRPGRDGDAEEQEGRPEPPMPQTRSQARNGKQPGRNGRHTSR